jgi:hypothetical protein
MPQSQMASKISDQIIDNNKDLTSIFVLCFGYRDDGRCFYDDYDGIINLFKALEKNTVVQKLTIGHLLLDDEIVKALANFIENNKSVVEINLYIREVNVTENTCDVLAAKLQYNNCLQNVSVSVRCGNTVHSNVNNFIAAMCKGFYKNSSLQKLSFPLLRMLGENITPECAKSIALLLQSNATLRTLDLSGNDFALGSIQEIMEHGISNNQALREINLQASHLELASITQLANALKQSNIKVLKLDNSCFVNGRFDDLGSVIENNLCLQEFELSSADFTLKEAISLFKALKQNKTLKTLTLPSRVIPPESLQVLYESLRFNTGLQRINMQNQIVYENAVPAVCRALEQNGHLKSIDLMCAVSHKYLLDIIESVKNNKALQRLYLSNKPKSKSDMLADLAMPASLVEIFKCHPSLRRIILDLPILWLWGLSTTLKAIKDNKSLVNFTLKEDEYSHSYDENIATDITDIILTNKNIEEICLGRGVGLSFSDWLKVLKALLTNFYINHFNAGATFDDSLQESLLSDFKNEINANRKKNLNFCWRIFYENIGSHMELKLKRFFKHHCYVINKQVEDVLLFYSLKDEQRFSEQYQELRVKVVENILNVKVYNPPLSIAIKLGRLDICKALVNMGAQLPPDALDLAEASGETNVVEWVKRYDVTELVVFSKKSNALPTEVMPKIGSFLQNGHKLNF